MAFLPFLLILYILITIHGSYFKNYQNSFENHFSDFLLELLVVICSISLLFALCEGADFK